MIRSPNFHQSDLMTCLHIAKDGLGLKRFICSSCPICLNQVDSADEPEIEGVWGEVKNAVTIFQLVYHNLIPNLIISTHGNVLGGERSLEDPQLIRTTSSASRQHPLCPSKVGTS